MLRMEGIAEDISVFWLQGSSDIFYLQSFVSICENELKEHHAPGQRPPSLFLYSVLQQKKRYICVVAHGNHPLFCFPGELYTIAIVFAIVSFDEKSIKM